MVNPRRIARVDRISAIRHRPLFECRGGNYERQVCAHTSKRYSHLFRYRIIKCEPRTLFGGVRNRSPQPLK